MHRFFKKVGYILGYALGIVLTLAVITLIIAGTFKLVTLMF